VVKKIYAEMEWVYNSGTNEDNWFSASPQLKCWVRLKNSQEFIAIYVMGEWETLDGQQLTGVVQWMPLEVMATREKKVQDDGN